MSEANYDRFARRVFKALGREASKCGIQLEHFACEIWTDESEGDICTFHVSVIDGDSRKGLH